MSQVLIEAKVALEAVKDTFVSGIDGILNEPDARKGIVMAGELGKQVGELKNASARYTALLMTDNVETGLMTEDEQSAFMLKILLETMSNMRR